MRRPDNTYVAFINREPVSSENGPLLDYATGRMPELPVTINLFSNNEREVSVDPEYFAGDTLVHVVALPKRNAEGSEMTDISLLFSAMRHTQNPPRVALHLPRVRYSRSEKFTGEGVSVGLEARAAMICQLPNLETVYCYDLHEQASIAAFAPYGYHVTSGFPVAQYLRKLGNVDLVVAADGGGEKLVKEVAKHLHVDYDNLLKTRSGTEVSRPNAPRPSVRGKVVALVDDETSSGSTVVTAIEEMMSEGALGVHVVVLRNFANSAAMERMMATPGLASFASTTFAPGVLPDDIGGNTVPYELIDLPLRGFEDSRLIRDAHSVSGANDAYPSRGITGVSALQ